MAQVPEYRPIRVDGLKDVPDWGKAVVTSLNKFMREVISALTRLTFKENFDAGVSTVTFATSATYTGGDFVPLLFTAPVGGVTGVITTKVVDTVTPSNKILPGTTSTNWTTDRAKVTLTYVSGLANSTQYTITFLIF